MNDNEFIKRLNINNPKQIKTLENLHKKPVEKTRDKPRFNSPIVEGLVHQCDLLEVPMDNGYNYILSVVDVASKMIDCEKMKTKSSESALNAIKKIYARDIIKEPTYMMVSDLGSEFKGLFQDYFENKNVHIKKSDAGRHRQTGLVEAKNKKIGKLIFLSQTNEELETGKECRKWIKILPDVVKFLNEKQKLINNKKKNYNDTKMNYSKETLDILSIGENVQQKLDRAINVATGKPLIATKGFRETDIRWSKEIYRVMDIILQPNQQPLYEINNGHKKTLYTRQQLQPVDN